nr:ribosome-associated translation inhibitor RaiA [Streptomyces sp. CMB-StM0423]
MGRIRWIRWGVDLVGGGGGGESRPSVTGGPAAENPEAPARTGARAHQGTGFARQLSGTRSRSRTEFCVDIVVKGRKTEVPERFRRHVAEKLKLDKIQKFDGKVISLDVEVSKEHNPRLADRCDRVEITVHSRGPVVRAEAAAADPYAALDLATAKLEARLRKQHGKRKTRRPGKDRRTAAEVGDVVAHAAQLTDDGELTTPSMETTAESELLQSGSRLHRRGPLEVDGDGPLVVREKTHAAPPMTLDQALYEMELVGHDFYLFVDSDKKLPSVVYRRHAYDYGVIHLDPYLIEESLPDGAGGTLGG